MKNFLPLLLIFFSALFLSCTFQEECEGRIITENSLPDITIKLENGEHIIDLTSPRIFKHTAQKNITYFAEVIEEPQIMDASRAKHPETGEFTLVSLEPREKGIAKVVVTASDDCLGDVKEEFTVTIE